MLRHAGSTELEMLFRADMVWYSSTQHPLFGGSRRYFGSHVAAIGHHCVYRYIRLLETETLTKEYFLWFTLLSIGVFGFFISDRPVHHVHVL